MASWKKVIVSGSAAELSSLTLDTALPVAQGGIGASTLTDKAVLISQDSGTDTVGSVALTTNGQIIIGGADGPAAATITGTSNEVDITNGANSITVGLPNDVTITGDLTVNGGDVTLTGAATDIDVIDNNSSALSIDASGKAGILEIDSTNSKEQVKMSGGLFLSGNMTASAGTVSASAFIGDGSGLTNIAAADLDIDSFDAFSGVPHATDDEFLISDAGTEKRATMTMVANGAFALVSGDATIAAGGALTIANDSVDNNMLANITRGSIKVGGTSDAPTDLDAKTSGQILVGDGTDIASVAVSGDVTLAANGAVTIANGSVENDMLAGSIANAKLANSAITIAGASTSLGGSITAATIGDAIGALSASVNVDHDATTNFVANEHIDHTSVSVIAGNGLTGGGTIAADRTLNIGAGTGVTVNANDVAIGQDVATTANVTFATASITQDLTVGGDLVVQGTQTSVNTANLLVEDRFILMNSGSATGDGGFIVQTESGFTGAAFGWDDSAGRFGLQIGTKLAQNATAIAPDAYASSVVTSDDANYRKNGNIRVDSGEIYIYVE